MRKESLLVFTLSCMLVTSLGLAGDDAPAAAAADRAAIEAAARDYIDGWFEGNAERMERALHPDLAKRTVRRLENQRELLQTLSQTNMVEYTRAGFGKQRKQEGQVNEVIILDVLDASASVKTICPFFIDYLHLAKINGEWKIVNVLWEPVTPAKPPGQDQ